MFWLRNLLGLEVVSLDNAKKLGAVQGFCVDDDSCVLTQTDLGWFKLDGLFSKKDVLVVEKHLEKLPKFDEILNASIFDTTGQKVGQIKDVFVDRQCKIKKILTENDQIVQLARIFCIGDVVLLKNRLPKTINPQKSQKVEAVKNTIEVKDEKTKIESKKESSSDVEEESVEEIASSAKKVDKKYGDFNYLTGRTCKKDIKNFQGEVMIKRNSVITKEVLRQAKVSGKLIELALNC